MNIHQLKASAESLNHGRLCRDSLRVRTSLLAILAAVPKEPSPEERAAVRAVLIEAFGLPESASDDLILQAVADLLDQAAADKTGEALGIARRPPVVSETERIIALANEARERARAITQHHTQRVLAQSMPARHTAPSGSVRLSSRGLITLGRAVEIGAGGELPSAVRLFVAGDNPTEKGVFIFDAQAAQLVLAHQDAMGEVDRMVDLEHLSLDSSDPAYNPDAMAWARLEERRGELWLTNIKWTPEGAERLRARKQRYLSPAFPTDAENRIMKIVNVALTSMPATHGAPALVSA
jgi:hypothetical protein